MGFGRHEYGFQRVVLGGEGYLRFNGLFEGFQGRFERVAVTAQAHVECYRTPFSVFLETQNASGKLGVHFSRTGAGRDSSGAWDDLKTRAGLGSPGSRMTSGIITRNFGEIFTWFIWLAIGWE